MIGLSIRRLGRDDVALYRAMRLEALRDAPYAFGTTHANASARTEASWREQVEVAADGRERALFVVFQNAAAVGMAALYARAEEPGVTEMFQVWVAPSVRGGRAVVALVDELVTWAHAEGFERVAAGVRSDNEHAARFYERYGFKVAGKTARDGVVPLVFELAEGNLPRQRDAR